MLRPRRVSPAACWLTVSLKVAWRREVRGDDVTSEVKPECRLAARQEESPPKSWRENSSGLFVRPAAAPLTCPSHRRARKLQLVFLRAAAFVFLLRRGSHKGVCLPRALLREGV